MTARTAHLTALQNLAPVEWPSYLAAHSGLPGPRANLELAQAVADAADAAALRSFAGSDDEFTALCGVIGLGRLLAAAPETFGGAVALEDELRMRATDARWRVREGAAMALQRLGDAQPARFWSLVDRWTSDVEREPRVTEAELLVLRAVVAGVAEPRLVKTASEARRGQAVLRRVTELLERVPGEERRQEGIRVLRQALGYAWSVVLVGAPEEGFDLLEGMVRSGDRDLEWIVRENLRKTRLVRAGPQRAADLASRF
ncbi:HEAT repeat domain-containing protein [Herbiconiux sp. 11R-BC]|uniref:HEAT repeat domain-containing protein n=1 Tax=Herbiconiux sp. 11R-BC TaxID=3111637 RepID=UPI003BFF1591